MIPFHWIWICEPSQITWQPWPHQLEALLEAGVAAVLLRDPELDPKAYLECATLARVRTQAFGCALLLHSHPRLVGPLHADGYHLKEWEPSPKLPQHAILGRSIHLPHQPSVLQGQGIHYVTLGNIFATSCKKGKPGIGLEPLKQLARALPLPVFGVGGINVTNAPLLLSQRPPLGFALREHLNGVEGPRRTRQLNMMVHAAFNEGAPSPGGNA